MPNSTKVANILDISNHNYTNMSIITLLWSHSIPSTASITRLDSTGQPKLPTVAKGYIG